MTDEEKRHHEKEARLAYDILRNRHGHALFGIGPLDDFIFIAGWLAAVEHEADLWKTHILRTPKKEEKR